MNPVPPRIRIRRGFGALLVDPALRLGLPDMSPNPTLPVARAEIFKNFLRLVDMDSLLRFDENADGAVKSKAPPRIARGYAWEFGIVSSEKEDILSKNHLSGATDCDRFSNAIFLRLPTT